jgi:hypothetical protein
MVRWEDRRGLIVLDGLCKLVPAVGVGDEVRWGELRGETGWD